MGRVDIKEKNLFRVEDESLNLSNPFHFSVTKDIISSITKFVNLANHMLPYKRKGHVEINGQYNQLNLVREIDVTG